MGQWDNYNSSLIFLNSNPTSFMIANGIEAVCEHLCLDNLAFSTIREDSTPFSTRPISQKLYAIHPNGIKLIANLPESYAERPYEYFLKLKEDEITAEIKFKKLINDVNESTLTTSKSIKSTARWTKWLFAATLIVAVGIILLAIYPFIRDKEIETLKEQTKDKDRQIKELKTQIFPPRNPSDSAGFLKSPSKKQ